MILLEKIKKLFKFKIKKTKELSFKNFIEEHIPSINFNEYKKMVNTLNKEFTVEHLKKMSPDNWIFEAFSWSGASNHLCNSIGFWNNLDRQWRDEILHFQYRNDQSIIKHKIIFE